MKEKKKDTSLTVAPLSLPSGCQVVIKTLKSCLLRLLLQESRDRTSFNQLFFFSLSSRVDVIVSGNARMRPAATAAAAAARNFWGEKKWSDFRLFGSKIKFTFNRDDDDDKEKTTRVTRLRLVLV